MSSPYLNPKPRPYDPCFNAEDYSSAHDLMDAIFRRYDKLFSEGKAPTHYAAEKLQFGMWREKRCESCNSLLGLDMMIHAFVTGDTPDHMKIWVNSEAVPKICVNRNGASIIKEDFPNWWTRPYYTTTCACPRPQLVVPVKYVPPPTLIRRFQTFFKIEW